MADDESQVETAAAEPLLADAQQVRHPIVAHWAMNFIGIGTIALLCYYGELVWVLMMLELWFTSRE